MRNWLPRGSEDNSGSGFLGEAPKPRLLPKGAELPFLLPVCVPSSSPAVRSAPTGDFRQIRDRIRPPAKRPRRRCPPKGAGERGWESRAGTDFIGFVSEPGGLPPSLHPEKIFTHFKISAHFTVQRILRWPNHLTRLKLAYR